MYLMRISLIFVVKLEENMLFFKPNLTSSEYACFERHIYIFKHLLIIIKLTFRMNIFIVLQNIN